MNRNPYPNCCNECRRDGVSVCAREEREEEELDHAHEWLSFVAQDYRPHMLAAIAAGAGRDEAIRWTWDHMLDNEPHLAPIGAGGWAHLRREMGE